MPLGQDVSIPREIFVRCPLAGWKLRQARRCDGCEHQRGVSEQLRSDGPQQPPFEAAYAMRCAFPMDRELVRVDLDLDLTVDLTVDAMPCPR